MLAASIFSLIISAPGAASVAVACLAILPGMGVAALIKERLP